MRLAQRHRLIVAALLGTACLALLGIWLLGAKGASTPAAAAAAPAVTASPVVAEATTPPDWLVRLVPPLLNRFTVGEADMVSSLAWVKTTWGAYETAVGGGGDKSSVKPAYVVIAHGKFTSEVGGSRPGGEKDEPISVTTVVMSFDGTSQKPSTIDALYKASSFDEAGIGEMQPLPLPTVSE
jgi:hypothetical protein